MTEANGKSGIVYNPPTIMSWRDEGYFTVPRVVYRGQAGIYLLFEKMTLPMNQEQLSQLYETEKQNGNPVPTDAPLLWAIATRAHELRTENTEAVERLRQFFKECFRKCPNTLTRINYSPENDMVIHNIGTSGQYSLEGNVVGLDNQVDRIPDPKVLESILGTQNILQINAVSQWINGTNPWLLRLNSKPEGLDKRVARFDADDNRLYLNCDRYPLHEFPAFRVLQVE